MNAMSSFAPVAGAGSTAAVSRWCVSRGKRAFDLAIALPVLTGLLPLMAVIAIAVKLSSPGPVLFRQQRSGHNAVPFTVFKFRTMRVGSHSAGPGVTQSGDPRVFTGGRYLRKWKLDELPQLFNVVKGDMSLVGPRPDLPEYFKNAPPAVRAVLQLRPGVTGMASLTFRHEEEMLAGIPPEQLTQAYVARVMPAKAELDLQYAARATFFSDLAMLVRTATAIFH